MIIPSPRGLQTINSQKAQKGKKKKGGTFRCLCDAVSQWMPHKRQREGWQRKKRKERLKKRGHHGGCSSNGTWDCYRRWQFQAKSEEERLIVP